MTAIVTERQIDALADAIADRMHSKPRPLAVDVAGACALLGCSWDFWRDHVASHVRIVRRGRRKLIAVAELETWLDQNADTALGPRASLDRTRIRGV